MYEMPAKWQDKNIRYLGIIICSTNEQMLKENVNPIMTYMEDKVVWNMYKLSWLGEVAAVKMLLAQTLNKIQSILNRFIWSTKKPRFKLTTVEKKWLSGGLAIPNIRKYYYAKLVASDGGGCQYGIRTGWL